MPARPPSVAICLALFVFIGTKVLGTPTGAQGGDCTGANHDCSMTASTCAVWEESFHGCVWAMAPHARGEPLEHMSAGSRGLPASAAILARWLPGSARIQGEVCTCPVAAGWTAREAPPPDADDGALAGDSPDMPIFSGASAGGVEEPREGAADQQPHTEGAGGGHAAADGADAARGSSDKGGATDARADPGGSLGAAGPGSDGSPPGSGTETVGPPSGTEGGSRGAGQGHPGAVIPPDAPRLNYASSSMGAKVIHANPGAKKSSEVLTESSATYTLSPCPNDRWLVVEMPQEVLVDSLVLEDYEMHSSRVRDFAVYSKKSRPTLVSGELPNLADWRKLGSFTARNVHSTPQEFVLDRPQLARYILIHFTSYWGSEVNCCLSILKVMGVGSEDLAALEEGRQRELRQSRQGGGGKGTAGGAPGASSGTAEGSRGAEGGASPGGASRAGSEDGGRGNGGESGGASGGSSGGGSAGGSASASGGANGGGSGGRNGGANGGASGGAKGGTGAANGGASGTDGHGPRGDETRGHGGTSEDGDWQSGSADPAAAVGGSGGVAGDDHGKGGASGGSGNGNGPPSEGAGSGSSGGRAVGTDAAVVAPATGGVQTGAAGGEGAHGNGEKPGAGEGPGVPKDGAGGTRADAGCQGAQGGSQGEAGRGCGTDSVDAGVGEGKEPGKDARRCAAGGDVGTGGSEGGSVPPGGAGGVAPGVATGAGEAEPRAGEGERGAQGGKEGADGRASGSPEGGDGGKKDGGAGKGGGAQSSPAPNGGDAGTEGGRGPREPGAGSNSAPAPAPDARAVSGPVSSAVEPGVGDVGSIAMRPQFWGHGVWDKLAAVREASEMVGRELEDESSTQRLLRKVAALEWAQSLTVGLVEEVVAELDGALGAIGTGAAPGLGPSTELLLERLSAMEDLLRYSVDLEAGTGNRAAIVRDLTALRRASEAAPGAVAGAAVAAVQAQQGRDAARLEGLLARVPRQSASGAAVMAVPMWYLSAQAVVGIAAALSAVGFLTRREPSSREGSLMHPADMRKTPRGSAREPGALPPKPRMVFGGGRFNHALSSFPVDPSHGSASDGEGLESPGAAGSGDLGGRGWARTILWTVLVANGVMGIALHARFLLASF